MEERTGQTHRETERQGFPERERGWHSTAGQKPRQTEVSRKTAAKGHLEAGAGEAQGPHT